MSDYSIVAWAPHVFGIFTRYAYVEILRGSGRLFWPVILKAVGLQYCDVGSVPALKVRAQFLVYYVRSLNVHHIDLLEVFAHYGWLQRHSARSNSRLRRPFLLFDGRGLLFLCLMKICGRLDIEDSFLLRLSRRHLLAMLLAWVRRRAPLVFLRGTADVVGCALTLHGIEDVHVCRGTRSCLWAPFLISLISDFILSIILYIRALSCMERIQFLPRHLRRSFVIPSGRIQGHGPRA